MAKRSESDPPDNSYIPKDYDDLYATYFQGPRSLARVLTRRILPYQQEDEREELAHEAYLRLLRFDILAKFDSEKANFGGAIFFAVRSTTANFLSARSRNVLGKWRAGSLVFGEPETLEPRCYRADTIAETASHEDDSTCRIQTQRLFAWAKEQGERPGAGTRERCLFPLLKLLYRENPADIRPGSKEHAETIKALSAEMGYAASTIRRWLEYLQHAAPKL